MAQKLKLENEALKLENENLKMQIQELNENTVIQSMNDMKEQYEQLKNNTVSLHMFENLRETHTQSLKILNSVDSINRIIIDDFAHFRKYEKSMNEEYRISQMDFIANSMRMISKIILKYNEEWETECHCDCEDENF